MQELHDATDEDVEALEALTRVLVGIAWESAHGVVPALTFPQVRLLLALEGLGRVPSSRLASAMAVNASSVTRLADKLEAQGYVVRGADEHNRSVVTLEVTDAGKRVVAQVLRRRHAAFRILLDRLSPNQRKAAAGTARHLVRAAAGASEVRSSGPGPL